MLTIIKKLVLCQFHWNSLPLNAEVDDSSTSLAHLPIVNRLVSQFRCMCTGCQFWLICTSTIFGESEFHWNVYITKVCCLLWFTLIVLRTSWITVIFIQIPVGRSSHLQQRGGRGGWTRKFGVSFESGDISLNGSITLTYAFGAIPTSWAFAEHDGLNWDKPLNLRSSLYKF